MTMTIPILQNDKVALLPLEEQHLEQLQRIAQNKGIWIHFAVDGSDPAIFRESLHTPNQQVFVIVDRGSNLIIGSTRYLSIDLRNRKLEIGWTWLHPDYWGKGHNAAAKALLIRYAFENLGMLRIQFRTDENNSRSRKAIEKLGATFEGVHRNDLIRSNGTPRNSAYYSLIPEDLAGR